MSANETVLVSLVVSLRQQHAVSLDSPLNSCTWHTVFGVVLDRT